MSAIETIRIFIASSAELAEDRTEFRNFLSVENDSLHKRNVYLELVQWEHFLDAVSQTRLQDEYNVELTKCDVVICLFYTKAGKYTQEEFDTALRQFQETGKPLIYTYFKSGGTEPNSDLVKFKKRLADIGHFYTLYKNIDNLQNQFRKQLDLLEDKGFVAVRNEVRRETEQAVTNYFNIKNAVINSTIVAGGNVQIGDQTIINYGDRKVPHALTSNPFLPPVFLGRQEDLQAIHDKLFSGENMLLLVNGNGGVGKTSLASKYYHRYQNEYAHVGWVLSEKNIAGALLLLAGMLRLQFDKEMNTEERLQVLLTAMANLKKPCLLVIDNANEVEDLKQNFQYLRSCTNFHLLLTSRLTEFEHAERYRIEGLPEGEALDMFKKFYPRLQPGEVALFKQLHLAVGGNTLVIELLAKNLNEFNNGLKTGYALADLVHDLQQKGLLELSRSQVVETRSVAKGGALRVDKPENIIAALYDLGELPREETALLSFFAVLPAESIAFGMLETLLPGFADLDTRVLSLAKKGWIEYNENTTAFKCSPVVQEITRSKNVNLRADCATLVDTLNEKLLYQPGIGHLLNVTYDEALRYARYAETVMTELVEPDRSLDLLCDRIGNYHKTTGNLNKALDAFSIGSKMSEGLCAAEPDNSDFKNNLAISYEKLGITHTSLGNLEKALTLYEEYNRLEKELYAAYPRNVEFKNILAVSYSKLGLTHTSLGNLDKALTFYEKDIELSKELYASYPQNVDFKRGLAISYEKLGETQTSLGNVGKALALFEEFNRLGKELSDAYPRNVEFKNNLAISFSKLGSTYASLGNLDKTLTFYQERSRLGRELYDAYPQNVNFKNGLAISYSKLGETHTSLGNLETALSFFEKDIELSKELYVAYPQSVDFKGGLASSYAGLGEFYRDQKVDKVKAQWYFQHSYILWKELSEAYPSYAEFQKNLVEVKNALDRL